MKNLTIPFTEDFQFQSYANEQLNSTQYFAIGTYNGNNYAFNIAGQLKSQIEASVPIGCVNECYLCVPATANIGTCYVDSFATSDTSMAIWEDDYFKIPLFDHMNTDENSADYGAVLASVYCPDATTFAMLQPNLAWLEVEVFGFQLQVPDNELHVYKKDNTLALSKVHVSPKAIFTNADGQPEEVELERSSYSLSLTSDGEANYLNVSYLNQTVQKTISLHEYQDFFDDPDTIDEDEGVLIYGNDNSSSDLKMDIYFPAIPESSPCKLTFNAVITLHGGGWSGGDRTGYDYHTQRIKDNGLVCVNMDYSLLGSANIPNSITPCEKMLRDISAAISTLRTTLDDCGLILGKVALMGYSAGGHLALLYGFMLENYFANNSDNQESNSDDNEATLRPISLIIAEGAPTYFTLKDIGRDVDNSNERPPAFTDNHNYQSNIYLFIGHSNSSDVTQEELDAVSPLDVIKEFKENHNYQGKVLLAYGIESDENTTDDGLIKLSNGHLLEDVLCEGECKVCYIESCTHTYMGRESITNDEEYRATLNNVLQAFGRNEDIQFQ